MTEGKSFNMAEEFADMDFHSIRLEERFVRTQDETASHESKKVCP
jgi:hypothetical protein